MHRISRRLQRQAAVRGAGALAVAVALGLGAVQTHLSLTETGAEGHEDTVVVTSSTPTPEPSQESHEPSHEGTEPAHEPSTAPTTETHAPTSEEPSHPSSEEPSHGSEEPSHPSEEPSSAPSPENTAASGPLAVSVEMSPATIAAGGDTKALVTARDGEGRLLAVDITWGDGQTFHFSPPAADCPRTTHLNGSFMHRYNEPGSYVVHVTITSGDCAPTEKVTRESHVTVTGSEPSPTAEASPTNGPSQPTASATDRAGDNPDYVYLNAGGADSDGFVRKIVVSWGDGQTSVLEFSTSTCTNAEGTTHPVATHRDGNVSHHYAEAGSHQVTITTTSVACDGTHVQTGSATTTVTQ